ncbi:MAG: ISAs1 family transposase, partial [Capnocytophaga sp.]|nr:ISAs1 family transposase [Capnocytophaga sp.]
TSLLPETSEPWTGLKTIVKINSERIIGDDKKQETGYYISSESFSNPAYYNALARGHWGIENHLHWHLDVSFREDGSRARNGHAAENLSVIRKLALQIVKSYPGDKLSVKKTKAKSQLQHRYLEKLISCV